MSGNTGASLPALSRLMASSFASAFGLEALGTRGWHLPWPRGRSPVEDRGPWGAQEGCGVQLAMGHGTGHRDGRLVVAAAGGVDVGCPLHPGEAAAGKAVEEEEGSLQPSTARGWVWGGSHSPSAAPDLGLCSYWPWVLNVPILGGGHSTPCSSVRTHMMSPDRTRAYVTSSPREPVQPHPCLPRSLQQVPAART